MAETTTEGKDQLERIRSGKRTLCDECMSVFLYNLGFLSESAGEDVPTYGIACERLFDVTGSYLEGLRGGRAFYDTRNNALLVTEFPNRRKAVFRTNQPPDSISLGESPSHKA